MSNSKEANPKPKGQFLVYSPEDGQVKIEVRLENETVWLTQQHMADLFQTTKQNVSLHLQNIFKAGELVEDSVVKDSLTTAIDGKNYTSKYYNFDATISIGGIFVAEKRPSATHKDSLTSDVQWRPRDLEQTIARNVAEILEA